jgi:hypothetical protein
MKKMVGFDQKVQLHQLDYMAQAITDCDQQNLYQKIDDYLAREISNERTRNKTRTLIFKIWYHLPDAHRDVQRQALAFFPQLTAQERLLLHWGLTILAYPFARDFIQELGYFFRLQEGVSTKQLKRRMKQLYGDRRRVEVATEAMLTTLRSWGVLRSSQPGIQQKTEPIQVTSPHLKQWLTEVLLLATQVTAMRKEQINDHPLFFPFEFQVSVDELDNRRFTKIRQGVDMMMVGLK